MTRSHLDGTRAVAARRPCHVGRSAPAAARAPARRGRPAVYPERPFLKGAGRWGQDLDGRHTSLDLTGAARLTAPLHLGSNGLQLCRWLCCSQLGPSPRLEQVRLEGLLPWKTSDATPPRYRIRSIVCRGRPYRPPSGSWRTLDLPTGRSSS